MAQNEYGKQYKVNFHFDNYRNEQQDGRVRISLAVSLAGKREYYPILPKVYMFRKFWREATDPETGAKLGHNFIQSRGNPDYEKEFPVISEAKMRMEMLIRKILRKRKTLSHAVLNRHWSRKSDRFFEYIDEFANRKEGKMARASILSIRNVGAMVRKFDAEVEIAEITWEWLAMFQNWCLNEAPNRKKRGGKGHSKKSVADYFAVLSPIFKQARIREDIDEDPFQIFTGCEEKVRAEEPQPNPLSAEEVLRLHEAFERQELFDLLPRKVDGSPTKRAQFAQGVLQLMLVSAYTGVRFSDLDKFFSAEKHRILQVDGDRHISFRMKKGNRDHSVLISKPLARVCNFGEGEKPILPKLPVHGTLQRNFRKILKLLGIERAYTWHNLRSTFFNLARDLSNDDLGASQAGGHKSIQTTQKHYLKRSTRRADEATRSLNKLHEQPTAKLPGSEELLYELQVMVMLNPGLRLTPKLRALLKELPEGGGESVVVPFGVAR